MKKRFKVYYSTTSNLKEGKKIALKLLNQKKAICVNIVKDVNSFYLDEKKIINQTEVILIIKTFHTKKELEVFFEKEHNYSTPLIVEIKTGTPNEKYLDWFLNTSSDIKS
jgi:periplasmic divalent cation tolerance protein